MNGPLPDSCQWQAERAEYEIRQSQRKKEGGCALLPDVVVLEENQHGGTIAKNTQN